MSRTLIDIYPNIERVKDFDVYNLKFDFSRSVEENAGVFLDFCIKRYGLEYSKCLTAFAQITQAMFEDGTQDEWFKVSDILSKDNIFTEDNFSNLNLPSLYSRMYCNYYGSLSTELKRYAQGFEFDSFVGLKYGLFSHSEHLKDIFKYKFENAAKEWPALNFMNVWVYRRPDSIKFMETTFNKEQLASIFFTKSHLNACMTVAKEDNISKNNNLLTCYIDVMSSSVNKESMAHLYVVTKHIEAITFVSNQRQSKSVIELQNKYKEHLKTIMDTIESKLSTKDMSKISTFLSLFDISSMPAITENIDSLYNSFNDDHNTECDCIQEGIYF